MLLASAIVCIILSLVLGLRYLYLREKEKEQKGFVVILDAVKPLHSEGMFAL